MARSGGRPPIDPEGRTKSVFVRLPTAQYDALYQVAQRQGVSVPELLRRALAHRQRRQDERDEDE